MLRGHYKKHLRETEDIGFSDGSEQFDKLIAVGHGEKNSSDDDCVADKMHQEVITSAAYLEVFWDACHYQPYVYNELNKLLLNQLCDAPQNTPVPVRKRG